jgi:hypothetical protein
MCFLIKTVRWRSDCEAEDNVEGNQAGREIQKHKQTGKKAADWGQSVSYVQSAV